MPAVMLPSTTTSLPVTYLEASLARNSNAAAISRGSAGTSNAAVRASSCGSVGVLRPLASSGPILFQSPVAVMPG